MTRRGRTGSFDRAAMAQRRMAPGGRTLSESPIRRRVPPQAGTDSALEDVEPPPTPDTVPEMRPAHFTAYYTPDVWSSPDDPVLPSPGWASHSVSDGAIVVYQFFGEAAAVLPTPPPGWNVLYQGSVGGLSWLVTWARCTPTLNENWTTTDESGYWSMIIRSFDHTDGWKVAGTFVGSAAGASTALFPGGDSHGYRFPQPQVAMYAHDTGAIPPWELITSPGLGVVTSNPLPQGVGPNLLILSKHPNPPDGTLYDPTNPGTAITITLLFWNGGSPGATKPASGSTVNYVWGLTPG